MDFHVNRKIKTDDVLDILHENKVISFPGSRVHIMDTQ